MSIYNIWFFGCFAILNFKKKASVFTFLIKSTLIVTPICKLVSTMHKFINLLFVRVTYLQQGKKYKQRFIGIFSFYERLL
jgi:hypothetical protein